MKLLFFLRDMASLNSSERLLLSRFFLDHEHLLKSSVFARVIVFTLFTSTKIAANNSLLVAFAVFLLASRPLTVAALEVSFIFITHC